jgi:hypothetical protein
MGASATVSSVFLDQDRMLRPIWRALIFPIAIVVAIAVTGLLLDAILSPPGG